ncbi:MAG: TolC family protein [Planctomycetes bacterium]|nr:TolC family protein [Planctomycetota bacterium]
MLKLGLETAIRYALVNNLTLQAQSIDVDIARSQVSVAESAFDPDFHSSFNRVDFQTPSPSLLETGGVQQNSAIEGTRGTFDMGLRDRLQTGTMLDLTYTQARNFTSAANRFLNPDWSSSLTLSATQSLLRGGWLPFNQAEIRIARNSTQISKWKFYEIVSNVVLQVIEAYWDLVFLVEDVDVKKQSLDLAKDQLEINRVKVQQGVLAPLELKQNETSVYFRTAELIGAEKAVRDGEDVLRRLLFSLEETERWEVGLDPIDRPIVDPKFGAPDWKDAARVALERRPEIVQATVDLESKGIAIRSAETQLLPQLDLSGSYAVNALTGTGQTIQTSTGPVQVPINGDWSDNLSDLFDGKFRTWTVGLALDVPIGNREGKSNLLKAKYERRQALIRYRDLQNSIVQDVRESVRGIDTSIKTIEFTTKARESAEEQLRAVRSKFDVGLATNFEVLQLQEDLAQKRRDENKARKDYAVARARLDRARGVLVDRAAIGIDIRIDDDDR